ncbi:hypothetical protein [Blastococcus sp. CCUG 61487]|uniref:hypothetical protein n=1 Tax=Blastococcus sp. CCUG 61487 TaxID=1840703 RepID=UPI0010BF6DCC|nr:hypothetical protein [Blastococcus sp. CCUG 61487]TKJ33495.1 hypothetical protein A6V29_16010 [Blastococcus sp. CCUG 61487]
MTDRDQVHLDLSRFQSREDALQKIRRRHGFDDVVMEPVTEALTAGTGLSLLGMFSLSAITRARSLHESIVREIEASNPQATFALMRAFAETLAVIVYVADHPDYVEALVHHPKNTPPGGRRRRSIQTFIQHMDKHYAGQFGLVYAELSEITHYGSTAVWNTWTPVNEQEGHAVWTSSPRWRSERDFYVACAQLLELSKEMETALVRLLAA